MADVIKTGDAIGDLKDKLNAGFERLGVETAEGCTAFGEALAGRQMPKPQGNPLPEILGYGAGCFFKPLIEGLILAAFGLAGRRIQDITDQLNQGK